jgi:hypothetical protein
MTTDNSDNNNSKHNSSSNNNSRIPDEYDEKKVKELNREIMTVFGVYKASFGHASAALLSVLSYLSDSYMRQNPESKKILTEYFQKEFDKFLNKLKEKQL